MREQNFQFICADIGTAEYPFDTNGGNEAGTIVPCIFKDFELERMPEKAELTITALGIFELWVNGTRVGDRWFAPGWTDYDKLVYFSSYDILSCLTLGTNRMGTALADGWFAGNLSLQKKSTYGNRQPELAMNLRLTYSDGTVANINSDDSFAFYETEVRYADFYLGTMIDHRYPSVSEITASNKIKGKPVSLGEGTKGEILPDYDLCVRDVERLKIISETKLPDNKSIFDFGQNFVGVIEVLVKGTAGGKITVRYGEMLNDDGSLYTENLRGAKSTDVFICKGEETEKFVPGFTFHGFRYIEVSVKDAEVISLEGIVLTTDLRQNGDFTCDNKLVNQLYSNIVWGMKGNFVDLPTDCPQRDERLGWLGDAQVFIRTALYRSDCRDFYKKYMRNIRDTINEQGAPYELAPYVRGLNYGTAAWADAVVVIPYQHYLFYGDKSIITENLQAMEEWIAYQLKTSNDYCRPNEGYGDWLSIRLDETPKDLIGTAYFAYTSHLLSVMCSEIGEREKSTYYKDLYHKVRKAFQRHFISDDGRVKSDSQCSYLLTLAFELAEEPLESLVAKNLRTAILRDNVHLTCGFVGISLLLPVLSKWKMNDLAYTILLNETYPSWGYSIKNGATTIWERWNSYTAENGFGDVNMNSFNHYSLGSCGEWFTGYMCGILPLIESPNFRKIVIAPQLDPLGRIKSASAYYDTDVGRITSCWVVLDNRVEFNIVLPEGVSAMLRFQEIDYSLKAGENNIVAYMQICPKKSNVLLR